MSHDHSLDGNSTHEHTTLSPSILAEQPPTLAVHLECKKLSSLLRLPPEIKYQV